MEATQQKRNYYEVLGVAERPRSKSNKPTVNEIGPILTLSFPSPFPMQPSDGSPKSQLSVWRRVLSLAFLLSSHFRNFQAIQSLEQ
jgi:hypothetical protein